MPQSQDLLSASLEAPALTYDVHLIMTVSGMNRWRSRAEGAAPRTPRPGGGRAPPSCAPSCLPSVTETAKRRKARGPGRFRGGERACVGAALWPFAGKANPEVRDLRDFRLRRGDDWWVMEAGAAAEDGRDGPRERLRLGEAGRQPQNHEVRPQSAADRFPKHSYWLDLWLFILLDVVLFVFVYLLP
ncbi:sarcoplasmic/endoplasmic reticulum calcium ATPase regulator ARLN [Canis aureus]